MASELYGSALRTLIRRRSWLHDCVRDCRVALGSMSRTTGPSDALLGHASGTGAWPRTYTSSVTSDRHSVNRAEAAKFAKLAAQWWDPNGPFKPLHAMNRARCEFIKGVIEEYLRDNEKDAVDRTNRRFDAVNGLGTAETVGTVDRQTDDNRIIRVLDVGCGGGILSESLATMRFKDLNAEVRVLGIDVNQEGIDTAREHQRVAHPMLSSSRLAYRTVTVEDLLLENSSSPGTTGGTRAAVSVSASDSPSPAVHADSVRAFDITIASEVIEHVDHPQAFCRSLIQATAPGGRVIISTLNRTVKSYALAILGAETLLRMVPEGTHDWSKFLTPEEVVLMMTERGSPASLDAMAGMVFNPLTGLWKLEDDVDVNYISSFAV